MPRTSRRSSAASAQLDAPARFVALGMIASQAPAAALLGALRALRPSWEVRLRRTNGGDARGTRYRVEATLDQHDAYGSIDPWLCIKSALIAAFPEDKPNAVTAWDR